MPGARDGQVSPGHEHSQRRGRVVRAADHSPLVFHLDLPRGEPLSSKASDGLPDLLHQPLCQLRRRRGGLRGGHVPLDGKGLQLFEVLDLVAERGHLAARDAAGQASLELADLPPLLARPGLEVGDLALDEPGHLRVEAPHPGPRRQEVLEEHLGGLTLVRHQGLAGLRAHTARLDGRQPQGEGPEVDRGDLAGLPVAGNHGVHHHGCPRLPLQLGELARRVEAQGLADREQGHEDLAVDLGGEKMATPEGDAGEGERGGGHKFASPEVGTVSGAGGM